MKQSLRRAVGGAALTLALSLGAMGQGILPADLFSAPIDPAAPTSVEANALTFEADTNTILASGDVVLGQGGYVVTGENLVYNRATGEVRFTGAVVIRDPSGNIAETNDLTLRGPMRQAFLDSLTLTTYDGARVTADSTEYDAALQTFLNNATYAPCGECIDAQGRRIGWSMHATRVTYNQEDGSVYLEQPSLAILGIPIAWVPFLWLPDTSDTALANVRMPSVDSSDKTGFKVEVPITAYSSRWTDIYLTPTLLTRQGFLLGAEWVQRFDRGSFQIKASGLYQRDRSAFAGTVGDLDWRGAIQTTGAFVPASNWTAGWSYTAFTDAAYLEDYRLAVGEATVNQVFTTYLRGNTYFDARLQQFNKLGNVTQETQGQQAQALPRVQFDHIEQLAPGYGRIEISGRLLGVRRERDVVGPTPRDSAGNPIPPNVFGYAGNKQHASFEAGWTTQWIGAGGFVATPYVGGRADVAYYDGGSSLASAPDTSALWSATPIAAMDVRYPLVASDGQTVHLVEPIAQLVYRGSDTSFVGITNDDSHGVVLDDTNLFSFNRFSGGDRQETGLRANVGGRYQASFADGGYVELVGGQSFHLAGPNAFAQNDPAQLGVGSGLEATASYAVLGAYGALSQGVRFGGKVLIDSNDPRVARASLGASYTGEWFGAGLDYLYIDASPDAGVLEAQHEIGSNLSIPVTEYWTARGEVYWDLAAQNWLQVGGGLTYDDGYLLMGANALRTGPTHSSPNDTRVTASFFIKAPAGLNVGYTGGVPVPAF
jgi:LPS-assembly protein